MILFDSNASKVQDNTEAPSSIAKRILREVWGSGRTLTNAQHSELLREAGLSDLAPDEQPTALVMALALSGLLATWEADGQPRFASWFRDATRS